MTDSLDAPGIAARLGRLTRRIDDLERRLRPGSTGRPAPASAASRAAEIVVAASDSTDAAKAGADYLCSGTADDVTIQQALDDLNDIGYGRVLLMSGEYDRSGDITMHVHQTLQGQGEGNTWLVGSGELLGASGFDLKVADLNVDGDMDFSSAGSVIQNVNCSGQLRTSGRLSEFYAQTLILYGSALVAHGNVGEGGVTFQSSSSFASLTDVDVAYVFGEALVLAGTDNRVTDCLFLSAVQLANDNTSEGVLIAGTRNSFTNNEVRSWSLPLSYGRTKYGVKVDAAATAARVRFNDLRPGGGAWGTGAYNDAGTGTLASDNDT